MVITGLTKIALLDCFANWVIPLQTLFSCTLNHCHTCRFRQQGHIAILKFHRWKNNKCIAAATRSKQSPQVDRTQAVEIHPRGENQLRRYCIQLRLGPIDAVLDVLPVAVGRLVAPLSKLGFGGFEFGAGVIGFDRRC
jgi:hypothetical protein